MCLSWSGNKCVLPGVFLWWTELTSRNLNRVNIFTTILPKPTRKSRLLIKFNVNPDLFPLPLIKDEVTPTQGWDDSWLLAGTIFQKHTQASRSQRCSWRRAASSTGSSPGEVGVNVCSLNSVEADRHCALTLTELRWWHSPVAMGDHVTMLPTTPVSSYMQRQQRWRSVHVPHTEK